MRPRLAAVAQRQHGLFTRPQALAAGYSAQEIRRHARPGAAWVPVRRGVYVERGSWDAAGGYGERAALHDRAVHLTMGVPHVLSHDSAARAHGLPLLPTAVDLTHVTRPGVGGSRTEFGVKHHLGRSDPGRTDVDDLMVTELARTALDLGREHGHSAGVVACDAALRRGVTPAELEASLERMRSWPHVTAARAAVEDADPGAESAGESLARLLVRELGIGDPVTQFPVRTGGSVAWCDLRVGNHVFEFDGRVKYLRREEGGVADTGADEVVWTERRRERLIAGRGLGVSRLVWADLWGPARVETRTRLLAEYAVSLARFGPVLAPALAEEAARLRGRRRPTLREP